MRSAPAQRFAMSPTLLHRSEVAGEDNELGVGGKWRDEVTVELDVEVGKDLDEHWRCSDSSVLSFIKCRIKAFLITLESKWHLV